MTNITTRLKLTSTDHTAAKFKTPTAKAPAAAQQRELFGADAIGSPKASVPTGTTRPVNAASAPRPYAGAFVHRSVQAVTTRPVNTVVDPKDFDDIKPTSPLVIGRKAYPNGSVIEDVL